MIENVVKALLTKSNEHICLAKDALEIYRIIDMVLEKYYNSRKDDFLE